MFYLAKMIEALGIVQVTYGLLLGMTQANALRFEMKMMVAGALIFGLGRLLEWRASA
jgi:hypothetical protein